MRRFALKLEYDGTSFHGWQLQASERTVQGVVEEAVQKATDAPVRVVVQGASRTDAGVHAQGQVAHFDTESELECDVLQRALNFWLPRDVSVLCISDASADFHSRFSTSSKIYRYRVLPSRVPHPLRERFCLRFFERVDITLMQQCTALISGTHDFASFTTEMQEGQNTVRTVMDCGWQAVEDELHFAIEADGFLYNMVRALVGTMLDVGRGKLTIEEFEKILLAKDRRASGQTAPPQGLTLMAVKYPPLLDPFARATADV